ncbi:beta-mannosidase mndA [Cordyceps militaris CM01]|uniref:Beta-mannosidase A n=1 Tax=Cordyceps militaris (strain CM01) TaxID=983644 RepID=G3JGD7_CORMM|nr:beta-mannosidase mndA [Cordyceps militaris CM01]EGX93267.1 beta-mannosidase mndA [Cordyceps militaris CM01]
MAMHSASVVPSFYSFFFKNLDPLIALWGVYLNFVDPDAAVKASAPASAYDPRQVFLFHQAGGLALAVAVVSAILPRYSQDLGVWRIVQFALLLSDVAGLSGIYHSLANQGRLGPAAWTSDDKGLAGSYLLLTVVRALFLLGVGFGKPVAGKNPQQANKDRRTHEESLQTWLVFDGLDTFATVKFCDEIIGSTNNQFRQWKFDITSDLAGCKGEPILSINFGSAPHIANAKNASEPQPWSKDLVAAWTFEVPNRNFVRKQQSDFGWDWSPAFTPAGPWKSGRIVQIRNEDNVHAVNTVIDVYRQGQTNNFAPHQNKPWVVNASIDYIGNLPNDAYIDATIGSASNDSSVIFRGRLLNIERSQDTLSGSIEIDSSTPKLWWPNGMGDQCLYTIQLEVRSKNSSAALVTSTRRFGFRTILLSTGATSADEIADGKQPGNDWHFEMNGHQFYVKGASIVPPDVFWPRTDIKQMSDMFDAIQHQNFNMLRVWSSGSYLPDFIYDIADERGILLWSEFQFGDALYPDDEQFIDNVRREATENVRRVNHHPSLACWAGGNEIENVVLPISGIADKDNFLLYVGQYEHLYIDTLFRVVAANTRSISYTPSSGNNGWTRIDMSLPVPMVQVYENKTKDYIYGDTEHYNYSAVSAFDEDSYPVGRFAAEFGFHSMPSLETWRDAIDEEDLHFNSSVILSRNHHYPPGGLVADVSKSLKGVAEMTAAVQLYYPLPNKTDPVANFSAWCHATQLFQADFYQSQIQFYRRGSGGKERQRGTLFWQLNDVWQAPTWAALEYGGRWKVLPYYIRRGYQNVVVSTSWDSASKKLQVWVASDLWHAVAGEVTMTWIDLQGRPLKGNLGFPKTLNFTVDAISSTKVYHATLRGCGFGDLGNALLLLTVEAHGTLPNARLVRNLTHEVSFLPGSPKGANITDPGLHLTYDEATSKFTVEATKSVSLYTWLTHPADMVGFFDDNAFVLLPGQKREIGFTLQQDQTNGSWVHNVTVNSLWDLNHE